MERRVFPRRAKVQYPNKSISVNQRSSQYNVKKVAKQNLTPLQRLHKFKKLQEKQVGVQLIKPKNSVIKRVTFADEMTTEEVVLNGSHEPDLNNDNKDEKILKPRKSILTNEEDKTILQNGNSENGSVSDSGDNDNIENGYDEEVENGANKPNKRGHRQKNIQEKRESTPNRQSLPREAKTVKESTPKLETPTKRELRRREPTSRETTPKPETPNKRELKRRGTPSKSTFPEGTSDAKLPKYKDHEENEIEKGKIDEFEEIKSSSSIEIETNENSNENIDPKPEESVVVIEESVCEDNNVVNITESEVEIAKEKPQERSFFSAFRKSIRRSSSEMKDACEASSSSQSVICLDSSSLDEEKILPSKDIKGRKPINSFSRFPGRNVSFTSIDKSLKRKADDSFEEEDIKRFAGETASGSEKSPGWHFFSPTFNRVWSPASQSKASLPSSTPFHKNEHDSMAVNYDSKTRLSLDDSIENEQKASTKWCTIM